MSSRDGRPDFSAWQPAQKINEMAEPCRSAGVVADMNANSGDSTPSPSRIGGPSPLERVTEAAVLTFLIADVRGYTRFTQEHGDEEAGRLASSFAALARETILSCGGELIELRGDEALCVFGSARQALRASVELQTAFRRQTDDGPTFPLPIGVGLDAGEAVPIEGGYRGGALNTAARLCSLAGPGQILATDTVVTLARRLEGIRFLPRRPVRLKGFEQPVRVIEVLPEGGLPPLPVAPTKKRPHVTTRRLAAVGALGLALLAALVALVVVRATGRDFLASLEPNAIGAIDAEAAGIESQLSLGSAPSAIAAGGGFLWVAGEDGTISRFDPEAQAVQTLTVGGSPGGIAYGAGSLWVTNTEERSLVQINPETSSIVQRFEVGNGPSAVAVGKDAVWVANAIDGTVSRIDLARGRVTDTIPVGPSPAGIAVGAGSIWITSEGAGTVVRLDPASRSIVEAVNVGNGPTAIAAVSGGVWVVNSQDGTVSRIDPATNSVSTTIRIGRNPSAVAADSESVWVASSSDGTITRVDPEAGEIDETLALGSRPNALVLSDGTLWTTTAAPLGGHRGGVLRVDADPSACRCADPAFGFQAVVNLTDQNIAGLVYDGLVAYRRGGGPAGGALVGNLARDVPAATDEGKAFSFELRRGIRYSDGTPLVASDFRSSIERLLTINPEDLARIYEGILGAGECLGGEGGRCDLSQGIEVDDRAGTITIRLAEPDPDFLHKLTLPLASVVPAGTPRRVARTQLIPGTGPYRVASFGSNEIRLTRNPHFRSWSPEARPDGYPDEIRFHTGDDLEASVAAVEQGDADWVSLTGLPAERYPGLLTRHADRLHSDPEPFSFWMFLNTRVPPFDDVRVRRALNFAADRRRILELAGGAIVARVSCQILPQGFPAYRPYCPHTRNPNPAGTWTAPDLDEARALVAASGTQGMRVEVLMIETPVTLEMGRYFVSLLRRLGYRSSMRTFADGAEYFAHVSDSRNRAQMGQAGIYAGFLTASSFLNEPFTCEGFTPGTSANVNLSQFCDRGLDAKASRAAELQTSNPVGADELWAEIDRALVDRAVALPLVNGRNRAFVSERVGNYQSHPLWGTLLDQLWVK